MMKLLIVLGFVTFCTAYVLPVYYMPEYNEADSLDEEIRLVRSPSDLPYEYLNEEEDFEHPNDHRRERRSFQPGAPGFPMPGQNYPTSVTSNIEKQGKNTMATINAQHKTDKYDVDASWDKVIRGPGKSKPNWKVGGTYRW